MATRTFEASFLTKKLRELPGFLLTTKDHALFVTIISLLILGHSMIHALLALPFPRHVSLSWVCSSFLYECSLEFIRLLPISILFLIAFIWYRLRIFSSIKIITQEIHKLGNEDIELKLPRTAPNPEVFGLIKSVLRAQKAQERIIQTLLNLSSVKELQDETIRIGERSDLMKLEILREIRHKTCNFLNAISMTTQMLLCHLRRESNIVMSPRHQEEALVRIDTLVRHIEAFTTDSLEREHFNPCDIMQECIDIQKKALIRGGINLEYAPRQDLPPIFADKIRFIQAINGLIRRASDFLVSGETIRISLKLAPIDYIDHLIITIEDNGYGIPEKKRQELFEMHDGRGIERDIDGIELSIASVRKLLILHGGDLELTDEWGKGSIITIHLPYQTTDESPRLKTTIEGNSQLPSNVTPLFKVKNRADV
ncbi:MAG: HAMP domain-containing histidine kinase [Alphaproteobacteria bacterium]|nr:HAMP domain-containing histidine kinase [Alphaproteobacteria bacterium]